MLIFRSVILFWVTARIGLDALALKHRMLCFSSCLFKAHLLNTQSPLIGQLTHACTAHHVSGWLCRVFSFQLASLLPWIQAPFKCASWRCNVMSGSHRIKGGTTDEEFQEQCFLWEEELLLVQTYIWTFRTFYTHKNLYNSLKERKSMKRCSYLYTIAWNCEQLNKIDSAMELKASTFDKQICHSI